MGVIADQPGGVAHEDVVVGRQCPAVDAGALRPARPVDHRAGAEASGSKPGKEGCDQMPEKSGMAAAAPAGPAVWPKAGVTPPPPTPVTNPNSRTPPLPP